MIFSTNTEPILAEFQVIYQRVLAGSHEAKTRQLDITFPAWFSAALSGQGIRTCVCLSRYTHVPCGTKQTETTIQSGDKQMYNLESHLYLSSICWQFLYFN